MNLEKSKAQKSTDKNYLGNSLCSFIKILFTYTFYNRTIHTYIVHNLLHLFHSIYAL